MALRTDIFDLSGLHLSAGEGRRLDLEVAIEPFELGGEGYETTSGGVPVRLDISRTTGEGYALRLRFTVELTGPCMRCLQAARVSFDVDAREVSQPREGDDLQSPYVEHGLLDLHAWARDALGLMLPTRLLCRPDCAGLCPICGADLNLTGPGHEHERDPDPRWAKLSRLRFD